MSQSRRMSFVEACLNTASGFLLSLLVWHWVAKWTFANHYLDVWVDGVLKFLGDPIPVTPGVHVIVATCKDNVVTQAQGAFANIQIVNQ